nr:hypothetical protein [Methanobrevibacter arboriphilus]
MSDFIKRYEIESSENWMEWRNKIPYLDFPSDWQIKINPPFGGALIRFNAKKNDKEVSVYLDVNNALGYYDLEGTPYWEIFLLSQIMSDKNYKDIERFELNDVEGLLKGIKSLLED